MLLDSFNNTALLCSLFIRFVFVSVSLKALLERIVDAKKPLPLKVAVLLFSMLNRTAIY